MCSSQQHTCGMLIFIQHVWILLHTSLWLQGLLVRKWNMLQVCWLSLHSLCIFCWSLLEHSTNMSYMSLICCSCRCATVKNIFCILPSITNSIHWPATVWYCAEWVPSLSFKRSWLSWCFPKQEMKLNKVWTSMYEKLPFICSGSIVQLKVNEWKKLFLTVPQDQHCCHTVLHSILMLVVYWCGHWPYGTSMVVLAFWSHCISLRFW